MVRQLPPRGRSQTAGHAWPGCFDPEFVPSTRSMRARASTAIRASRRPRSHMRLQRMPTSPAPASIPVSDDHLNRVACDRLARERRGLRPLRGR